MDRTHHCVRAGCGGPVTAILTYDYGGRTAWLHQPSASVNGWGLCQLHADRVRVPLGWALDDRRNPPIPIRPQIAV